MPDEKEVSPEAIAADVKAAYDAAAGIYSRHVERPDSYNNLIERPCMLGLLGDVKGRRVLDLCCADGFYARECARRGAVVTGVDMSQKLIEIGKDRAAAESLEIEFICGDAAEVLPRLQRAAFDGCVSGLGVGYSWDLDALFKLVAGALKPRGWFLFSTTHPLTDSARPQTDEEGRFGRLVRDYFKQEIKRGQWPTVKQRFNVDFDPPSVRRPIEDYTEALFRAGFLIERLLEPRPAPEYRRENPARYEHMTATPHFLVIRALNHAKDA